MHTLGSLTALCCTDKKGILSWPNTSPEKIFMIKKEERKIGSGEEEDKKSFSLTPEILNITNDPRDPFKVSDVF